MSRFCVLLCALLGVAGCASEGGRGAFDDALKDLRGDNMQMRNSASLDDLSGQFSSMRPPS